MMFDQAVATVGVIASLTAAVLWLWASLIKVPDNIDTFIGELQRIGRLNAWGATAACVAALCAAYAFWRSAI
jgi:hypothetical protein